MNRFIERSNAFSLLLAILIAAGPARAATINGTVRDPSGQPVAGASVLVYSADVRKGYSTFCPTCYVDCGKRAKTATDGSFSMAGLAEDLVFNLIVVQEGKIPAWMRRVDPQNGSPAPAVLKPQPATQGGSRLLARIVDLRGDGVPDAVVQIKGVFTAVSQRLGAFPDSVALSNSQGEFEIVHPDPARSFVVEVSPRGMAPTLYTANLGQPRHEITVSDGATVSGRLTRNGKPVPNAQFVITTLTRAAGSTFEPLYVGTDEKGRFAFTNVPIGRVWTLAANMDSVLESGFVETRYIETHQDGEDINVGDLRVETGYTLSGRVVLAGGGRIAPGMRVTLVAVGGSTSTVTLSSDGSFEFKGMKGAYNIYPQVRGYELPKSSYGEVLIDRNLSNMTITLEVAR